MDLTDVQRCRSWEEKWYWKNLASIRFCLILPDDFHDGLVLPQKFSENMIYKLPNKVSLTGPSGATWEATLKKTNNVAIMGDGWKEFVKAYDLKPTYVLMFKYQRSEGFKVFIFDPDNLCEKEAGYFVRKNDKPTINTKNHNDKDKKRSSVEAFGTGTVLIEEDENNFEDSEFVTSKRVRKHTEDQTLMGGTNHKQTQQIMSSGRVKRGGSRGRGRPRRGRISVTHLMARSVDMPKRNEADKEGERELGCSHEASDIGDMLGKKQNGNEGVEEHFSSESGEANLETIESLTPNETVARNETYGSQPVREFNSPENGESILDIVHRLRNYDTRGKKIMESEATKEHHTVVHSPTSIEVIGNYASNKSSGARTRPRKQSAPTKKSLVYENGLGDKSNTNEVVTEQNGFDAGANAPEMDMVSHDKTVKTRGQHRKRNTHLQET